MNGYERTWKEDRPAMPKRRLRLHLCSRCGSCLNHHCGESEPRHNNVSLRKRPAGRRLFREELRQERRTERLLRQSGLPREKTFRTFDSARLSPALHLQLERLKSGAFLEQACNVIAVGKPGVGKSHALAAVGHELVVQGHPVLWCSTASLVQRLLAAKRDLRLPQELARLDKFACVILDDIGYVQQDRDEMEVLFTAPFRALRTQVGHDYYQSRLLGMAENF